MKTKQLTINAMLSAMCAVLGYFSIDLGITKITLESFPILLASYIYGPISGLAVGTIGTFVYQFARYGIDVTTLFWIIPYSICGFLFGFLPKGKKIIFVSVFICQLLVTALNTFSLYYLYGTGSLSGIPVRLLVLVIKTILFGYILPKTKRLIK